MLSLIFANVVLREKLIFLSLLNQHPIITFELSLSFELWTQIEAKRQGKIARGGTTGQMLQARRWGGRLKLLLSRNLRNISLFSFCPWSATKAIKNAPNSHGPGGRSRNILLVRFRFYLYHQVQSVFIATTFLLSWHKGCEQHDIAQRVGLAEYRGMNKRAHIATTVCFLARTAGDGLTARMRRPLRASPARRC